MYSTYILGGYFFFKLFLAGRECSSSASARSLQCVQNKGSFHQRARIRFTAKSQETEQSPNGEHFPARTSKRNWYEILLLAAI